VTIPPSFNSQTPHSNWQPLLRDVVILVALVVLTGQLFDQAGEHQPAFHADDIHVIEAPIAAFSEVQVWEEPPGRRRAERLVTRSAMQLTGYPPNLRFYIPGSTWKMENDIPVGAHVRLEVTDDPVVRREHARAYSDATYAQFIAGLHIGDRVYFRALDTITRAEQAAERYQRLGMAALIATLLWGGRVVWKHRGTVLASLRE
jgi:hypothetical protein